MRQLPTQPNKRQKLIIRAVSDYYGAGINNQEKSASRAVALFLMGKRARLKTISEEQKSDMWAIKTNIEDQTYIASLSGQSPNHRFKHFCGSFTKERRKLQGKNIQFAHH